MITLDNFINKCQEIAETYGTENVMVDPDGYDGVQFYRIAGKIKTSEWNKQGDGKSNWTDDTAIAWREYLEKFDADCSIERNDETLFLRAI